MDANTNPKQQLVEALKGSTNVLVTVSNNPSVDQLCAAIALTLMLNSLDKHATAVFSGSIPPAISFLEPEKTLENNVDSLRDFIISLDRDKADHLRWKTDGDIVKIFITPYRTKIDQTDLTFSQGDFNVDTVVALGVFARSDIDAAIAAHGRILHDAKVVSVNTGTTPGTLGTSNWNDPAASSVSEMLMSISEALGQGLVDKQVATALLTGIVAETERFSNPKTTPKVMTMSAQLMAAGANQQLISSNVSGVSPKNTESPAAEVGQETQTEQVEDSFAKEDGTYSISHDDDANEEAAAEVKESAPAEESLDVLNLEPSLDLPTVPSEVAAEEFEDIEQSGCLKSPKNSRRLLIKTRPRPRKAILTQ